MQPTIHRYFSNFSTHARSIIQCHFGRRMLRNQYDSDVTVWSPQGRLHQIEYAMQAVSLGSATLGLKSATHAVVTAIKRASCSLSTYQKKLLVIDDHVGVTIAGLVADARILCRFMRVECINHKYHHNEALPLIRLMSLVGNKLQINTQRYDRRPFGVGLLVAGFDEAPHIYYTCPSANFYDCKAAALGSRSQGARTYLERNLKEFMSCSLDELIRHGLRALRDTLPNETEINSKNVSIGYVGAGQAFKELNEDEMAVYLSAIQMENRKDTGDDPCVPDSEVIIPDTCPEVEQN